MSKPRSHRSLAATSRAASCPAPRRSWRRAWLCSAVIGVLGCQESRGTLAGATPSPVRDNSLGTPTLSTTASSRRATTPAIKARIAATPDRNALAELLATLPAKRLPSTGPDNGTLIGTKVPSTETQAPKARRRRLRLQTLRFSRTASLPAVTRILWTNVAWQLRKRCVAFGSDKANPRSVRLEFAVMNDGRIDPQTVQAFPLRPKQQGLATCVAREMRSLAPNDTSMGLDRYTRITVLWPMAD